MTTDELLEAIAERGLTVALKDGKPVIQGPKQEVTPALLGAIKWHKEEIVRRLTPVVKSVVIVETPQSCPKCGGPFDAKQRCWSLKCGYRRCTGCGNDSGSVFIELCAPCGFKWQRGGM